jgi:CBS domain containing-hemolysin-like protein
LVEEKRRGSASLLRIVENVAPYLNVVLLLTLLCTIGGTTLATILATRTSIDLRARVHRGDDLPAVRLRRGHAEDLAVQQTDRVALAVAPILTALNRVFGPLATVLVTVANVLMPARAFRTGRS